MLKPLFHDLPERFWPILLRLNYLVCAPNVVILIAVVTMRAMASIIEEKQWRRMCMRSVASIMLYV